MGNFLSIDYGTKKSGIAYSVEGFCFAWKTLPTRDLDTALPQMIAEKNITEIVIGMPYNIDGSMSRHGKRVLEWKKRIGKTIPLPIHTHDERLTTSEAKIGFYESGYDGDVDAESARLILEDYLDK